MNMLGLLLGMYMAIFFEHLSSLRSQSQFIAPIMDRKCPMDRALAHQSYLRNQLLVNVGHVER